jgi:uncharacterized protein (DUF885 family)
LALFLAASVSAVSANGQVAGYLDRYFETFPTRATEAGRHDFDRQLENLPAAGLRDWIAYNREVASDLREALSGNSLDADDRIDAELLLRAVQRQIHDLDTLGRTEHDPLFWTGILSSATVFLLVRDELPQDERFDCAATRARSIPRLAKQARKALSRGTLGRISPELCELAAGQAEASARFYREGFGDAAPGQATPLREQMRGAGDTAADALERLAAFLRRLAGRATGSPRLGAHYAERFRLGTGVEQPVDQVLEQALIDLRAKRDEAADFGRSVWSDYFPNAEPPMDKTELLRRLFERVSADRAESTDEFVEHYRRLVLESTRFVRERDIITLPEPLTLIVDRSPAYFVGQSVGGVYAAGPYAPEGDTLLFLPTPTDSATDDERAAFFRDFNEHFNVMITPHELIPGHYLQLKFAARHSRKVRAIFPDDVYVEGWGTFSERLMLDLGWGDPLDRLAHLKKQLENIARTIVDIRVNTQNMTRAEVLRFVQDEALQDGQFASNMWIRAISSSPQLTTYYLGYREVWGLYEEVKRAEADRFELRRFMDGMMQLGPVPVEHYRARFLSGPIEATASP